MIEERDPEIKVNTKTPSTIINIPKICSIVVLGERSPYPTVVIVEIQK